MTMSIRGALCAVATLSVLGCSGDDGGSGPAPTIAVTVAPTALTLQQGTTGSVGVTLTRGGGFAAAVSVSVTGLPSGVTVTVAPPQLTGAVTSATVTVAVDASVAAGTYTATIRATAVGVGEATTTYTLTVTAIPNYALTAAPPAVTIAQGTSGTTTIGVARTNFTGGVALTLENPPAGITGAFSPTPATGDNSVLTINVAPTVTLGNHTLSVKGSAPGPGDKSTTVTVTVTPQPDYSLSATPNTLTITKGSNQTTTVNIVRTNFTGAVTLALDAPPTGITATFNPTAPTGNSSTVTVNVAATVATGNYTVTIKGTAAGVPGAVVSGAESVEAIAPGDRTTTVTVTVEPVPDYALAATPNAITVSQGGTGNTTVNITRTNFAGDIALTLAAPPAGITGVFTPPTSTGAGTSSALVMSVAGSVTAGVYPVTVQGAATGPGNKTTTVTVTVVSGPTVSLIAAPAALSIQQGLSGTSTLTATRTNYTGNIVPAATGQPGGMTVTFSPNPLTANTSTITVAVAASVAVGPYNLTITGASGVAGNPTTPLQVNVTAAPAGSNLVWEFCNIDQVPVKFWRKDGTSWAEVLPMVVGGATRFAFTISSAQGGVAYTIVDVSGVQSLRSPTRRESVREQVRQALETSRGAASRAGGQRGRALQGVAETSVFHLLTSELGSAAEVCETEPAPVLKRFNGLNLLPTEEAVLGLGGYNQALVAQTDAMVIPGTHDWMALFGPTPTSPNFAHNWAGYRVGRAETVPGPAVNVDRTGAPAFTTFPFTVSGGGAGSSWFFSEGFSGARGGMASFNLGPLVNSTGTGTLFFMAPGDRLSTDLVEFDITNSEMLPGGTSNFRSSSRYLASAPPASGSFALNQPVPTFAVSPVTGAPVPTWSTTGSIPTDYQTSQSIVGVSYVGAGDGALYSVVASRAWLSANGMSTTFTLAGQNLPGFLAAWAPAAPLDGGAVIMFSNLTGAPAAGSVFNIAIRTQVP